MWVWFFKTLCFVCVSFSSSLFITAAFFFALLLGTGYAIFRKYALQMNHQMIVVKLQPLWMLLVRGSTRVCSGARGVWGGWPLVWVVQAREEPLLQSLHAENIAWRSTKWRRASLTDTFTNFWPAQASATPKFPQGKNTAIWKKPSEVTPRLLRSLAGVWKARSQLIQWGLHGSTVQWIPFSLLISSHGKEIVGTFCRHKPLLVRFTTKSCIWI